jgi:NAD-dependent dihydropyrimidine dehydrogenase PreA subunit
MAETNPLWYPVIDADLCGADGDCVDLCEQNVFDWKEGRIEPVVARPHLCVEGCTLCVDICSKDALAMPALKVGEEAA